jgi:hypothetical protein
MEDIRIYRNSVNYIPIDVAKGIDRITGARVNADEIDPRYERLPKCTYCDNFTLNSEKIGLGWCSAEVPQSLAYPDMVAVTCENYGSKK